VRYNKIRPSARKAAIKELKKMIEWLEKGG
jgi:hypothetical protein